MILEISTQYAAVLLDALEERKSTLSTRAVLLPVHYPMQKKMLAELYALDTLISCIKKENSHGDTA